LFITLVAIFQKNEGGQPANKELDKRVRRVGILRAGQYSVDRKIDPPKASIPVLEGNAKAPINFKVTFNSFPENAKKAFQGVIDVWNGLLASNVTVRVDATLEALGLYTLGSAGANDFKINFKGAPRKDTWYTSIVNRPALKGVLLTFKTFVYAKRVA
jgi:hypothetical protein